MPDRLAGGGQRGVGKRQPECLGNDLRRRRRTQELAASAGTPAGSTTQLGGFGQRQLAVSEAGPDRLDLARVLAVSRRQGHTARDEYARQVPGTRQRHHHRGQSLVAGRDAEHALAARERPDQPSEHDGRVVAIGQAVHHPGRALSPAVARVRDHPRERDHVELPQLLGRILDEQADLPVARVVSQRDRPAIGCPEAALRAEDQERVARDLARRPAHARVLGQAEEVARRPLTEHLARERQRTLGAIGLGRHLVD